MKVRLKEKYPQEESAVIVLEEHFEAMLLYNILVESLEGHHWGEGSNEQEFCKLLMEGLEI